MTGVLITRGSLETDVHRGRTPCEDEGRVSLIKPIYHLLCEEVRKAAGRSSGGVT